MRRGLLVLLGGVAVLGAGSWFVGSMLPVSHVATGRRTLPRPAEDVYRMVADVERYPTWWKEVSAIDVLARDSQGRLRFRQHASGDAIVMEVVEQQPPTRFVTRIADPDQPFGGTWTFEIAPQGASSILTITERGEVYNPIFRLLSRFVFGHAGTIESCLDALEEALT